MRFFKERVLTVKSTKACSCCGQLILAGSQAVYQVGKSDLGFNYGYMKVKHRLELGERYNWTPIPELQEATP